MPGCWYLQITDIKCMDCSAWNSWYKNKSYLSYFLTTMRCRTNCKMSQLPLISPLFNEVNDCNSQHLLTFTFPFGCLWNGGEPKKPVSVRSIWFQRYLIVKKSVHPRICEVQYCGAFLPDKNSDKCALQCIWPIIWLQTPFNMFSCVLDLGKAKTTTLRLSFSLGSTFTRPHWAYELRHELEGEGLGASTAKS